MKTIKRSIVTGACLVLALSVNASAQTTCYSFESGTLGTWTNSGGGSVSVVADGIDGVYALNTDHQSGTWINLFPTDLYVNYGDFSFYAKSSGTYANLADLIVSLYGTDVGFLTDPAALYFVIRPGASDNPGLYIYQDYNGSGTGTLLTGPGTPGFDYGNWGFVELSVHPDGITFSTNGVERLSLTTVPSFSEGRLKVASRFGARWDMICYTPYAPMEQKDVLRDQLAALSPSGDAETDKLIADALESLDASLDPSRWVDEFHADPILGNEVFDFEKKAAKPLKQILEGEASSEVKDATGDIIEGLLNVDSTLAQWAIDSLEAACASVECPKELAKAWAKMDVAAAERAAGDCEKAIGHYKEAWEQAQKGLAKLMVAKNGISPLNGSELAEDLTLSQNYPNPFNPSTDISFSLPEASDVRLTIYDVTGREVARLADGLMDEGSHSLRWNAKDLPSGTYVYRLEAGGSVVSRKMLLMK